MSIAGLALDASSRSPIILLRDPSERRQVPIWIDHAQAHNIMAGITDDHPKIPLSQDLMMALIEAGGLHLDSVIIHAIEETTFQAVLKLKTDANTKTKGQDASPSIIEIKSRPSDAIALAVRSKCSIWMLEKVVMEASMPVDPHADQKDQKDFREFINQISPSLLIRHLKEEDKTIEGPLDSKDSDPKTQK